MRRQLARPARASALGRRGAPSLQRSRSASLLGDIGIGAVIVAVVVLGEVHHLLSVHLSVHPQGPVGAGRIVLGGLAVLLLLVLLGTAVAVAVRRRGPRRPDGARMDRSEDGCGPASKGWASRRDIAPLLVREVTGDRIVLGRFRHRIVAAEALQSVLVVGPSQSGKTTSLAIPALRDWTGPVLATSVKTDLVRDSLEARQAKGDVAVFDPTGVTGLPRIGWSPLSGATSWAGARRVADSLCSLGRKDGGIEDSGYWYAAAERLIAPLLRAAAIASGSMADVVRWLDEETVNEPLSALELGSEKAAARMARSCLGMEERQRSSVYSTAQTVLAAYSDPEVLASERLTRVLTPSWLIDGTRRGRSRTLYCCAPARDQGRLSPVFVALIRQALDSAFDEASRSGRPLDPPLLVVLDEAANIAPLSDLDRLLATAAGHGVSLITVWQDLAQIEARYGERWATIVNNHRAKVVCPGVADPRTLELLSSLIGDVEASQRSTSRAADGSWSQTESTWRVPVAPAGWIRRLPRRHSLVVYGGMPPALLRMRPWFENVPPAPEASGGRAGRAGVVS
ncbi:MAG: type IV secretory system conjugative DNA transfer family protein [Acidimicrobiales bacterium]